MPAERLAVGHDNEGDWMLDETDCCLRRGCCVGTGVILLVFQKLMPVQLGFLPRNIPKSLRREVLLHIESGHVGEHAHAAHYESELA